MFAGRNLDYLLFRVANLRDRYISDCLRAKSYIDTNIVFKEANDIVTYLPKATFIVIASPFPKIWMGEGSYPQNTLMRSAIGILMHISYMLLPGIFFAYFLVCKRIVLISAFLFSFTIALPMAIMESNLGTFYRFRFRAPSLLIALGIVGYL